MFTLGYQANYGPSIEQGVVGGGVNAAQVAKLNQQISSLNALVAMSMINSESASKRLAGIEYSNKVTGVDDRLNQALLQLLNEDKSTSIRLSALNAIASQGRRMGLDASAQQALLASLPAQQTLVQVNIVAVLIELGNKHSATMLQQMADQGELTPDAKAFLLEANNHTI